ncbi:tyrosine-type recombinase/integrase [Silvibacterium sp.]|uniref:tyrosine-type recombinase/integrase n=1 Tax=Silvibacterium sp. TaxID=1964179 RepID=UPI0039E43583
MESTSLRPEMTFAEAARIWIEIKAPMVNGQILPGHIRRQTRRGYVNGLKSAALFFGDIRLCDIRLDQLKRYQRLRVSGEEPFVRYRRPQDAMPRKNRAGEIIAPAKGKTPCPVKPMQVNQELMLVTTILRDVGLWPEERSRLYEPLILSISEMPRALSRQEQQRWLNTARSQTRWHLVYWYSLLAFDTCMGTNEIRGLRLGDLDLQRYSIRVPIGAAKNVHRHRDIAIANPDAKWALDRLIERAAGLGVCEPQHYLFPFGKRGGHSYVLNQPMTQTGLVKSWNEVREASGLGWFRMYDTRHTAITRLAEGGAPIMIIMKRAGHVSLKMSEHYTHISEGTEVDAVRHAQQGYFERSMDEVSFVRRRRTQFTPSSSQTAPQADQSAMTELLMSLLQRQLGLTSPPPAIPPPIQPEPADKAAALTDALRVLQQHGIDTTTLAI